MKGFNVGGPISTESHTSRSPGLSDVQRRLLHSRVHGLPGAPKRPPVDAPFTTTWGGGIYLVSLMGGLPASLLTWWAAQPAGHILLTGGEAGYLPGDVTVGDLTLRSVSRVPLDLLAQEPLAALALALQPLDHLLGCNGDEVGALAFRWRRHHPGLAGELGARFTICLGWAMG